MTVYHIVLVKFKPGVTPDQVTEFKSLAKNMVGQVPGLTKLDFGPPHPSTASRSKGFDHGIVAILEKPEDIKVYIEHPVHQKVSEMRVALCDDTLAYDMEF